MTKVTEQREYRMYESIVRYYSRTFRKDRDKRQMKTEDRRQTFQTGSKRSVTFSKQKKNFFILQSGSP
jgi:hypothetical protein